MTRDDFIPALESYLDEYEGTTPLPETVRMAVRAELPRSKQLRSLAGPARYLTMFSSRTAQVALGIAAAALVAAVGAFLSVRPDVGGPGVTPTPTAEDQPSASASAAATCEETQASVTGLGGNLIDISWCAYGPGAPGVVAFTMEGPSEWLDFWVPGASTLWLRPAGGGAITLLVTEDATVEEVAAELAGRSGYSVSAEQPVTLGGRDGVMFDVSLAEGTSSADAEPLIGDDDQTLRLQDGTFHRVWVIDLGGDVLTIATGEPLADALGDALDTVEWGR